MSPTSAQIILALLRGENEFSPSERETLTALLCSAGCEQPGPPASTSLLLTQKEVATLLGIDRTTVWRLTSMGILRPTEISPGTFRYPRAAVEALAQHGYRRLLKPQSTLAA